MGADLRPFADRVANWARDEAEIAEVWFYGSRTRGDHHDQSDRDVAVVTEGGARLGSYCFLGDRWQAQLAALLPVRVHLKNGDPELNNPIVAQAVARDGILVFTRRVP